MPIEIKRKAIARIRNRYFYAGRTYEEGKKINWKDAVSAIIQIIRFRFMD